MDNEEFIRQYAQYLILKRKEKLTPEEKREKDQIYTNIRSYVITGEELIDSDLNEYLEDKFFKNEETETLHKKLEKIEAELTDKQGTLVDKLNSILSSD